jgi:hypothetical protein
LGSEIQPPSRLPAPEQAAPTGEAPASAPAPTRIPKAAAKPERKELFLPTRSAKTRLRRLDGGNSSRFIGLGRSHRISGVWNRKRRRCGNESESEGLHFVLVVVSRRFRREDCVGGWWRVGERTHTGSQHKPADCCLVAEHFCAIVWKSLLKLC